MCMFCRSLFVLLYFFLWPLCYLFFDIQILITTLVSSSSSFFNRLLIRPTFLLIYILGRLNNIANCIIIWFEAKNNLRFCNSHTIDVKHLLYWFEAPRVLKEVHGCCCITSSVIFECIQNIRGLPVVWFGDYNLPWYICLSITNDTSVIPDQHWTTWKRDRFLLFKQLIKT
jgi:hypothetical protein